MHFVVVHAHAAMAMRNARAGRPQMKPRPLPPHLCSPCAVMTTTTGRPVAWTWWATGRVWPWPRVCWRAGRPAACRASCWMEAGRTG
ncbi:hypothetical protein BCR44DRAFT_1435991 [Catenaria anguillulae PL171]|uniref:Uncharacterized protein n=1 Tax=Catenaria anguillulae PL171 TaxID=765915 RepID=A0A1Y2HL63_9FUNG|nr:hypothetical protein BCR44DRAFT_1435991 [Catenaria anguillulae PL171]